MIGRPLRVAALCSNRDVAEALDMARAAAGLLAWPLCGPDEVIDEAADEGP